MGHILHSNMSCADIIDHISHEMRYKMVEDIQRNNRKFSLSVDESTSHSHASISVLCMRALVGDAVSPLLHFSLILSNFKALLPETYTKQ